MSHPKPPEPRATLEPDRGRGSSKMGKSRNRPSTPSRPKRARFPAASRSSSLGSGCQGSRPIPDPGVRLRRDLLSRPSRPGRYSARRPTKALRSHPDATCDSRAMRGRCQAVRSPGWTEATGARESRIHHGEPLKLARDRRWRNHLTEQIKQQILQPHAAKIQNHRSVRDDDHTGKVFVRVARSSSNISSV